MGFARSEVVMITGSRGSGKSLFMTALAVADLRKGKSVWSNMPVKVVGTVRKKYNLPLLKTKPLDMDAFYALSEELQDGVVCIDEAQNMGDSRASLTLKNRLLNAIIAQVRKRSLNVYFTVQDPSWVDVRLRFATDVEVECYDLAYSPWGRSKNVAYGELIRCHFKDLSGYKTGQSFFKTGKYYKRNILKGSRYWSCYDSKAVTDLEEAFTTVKLDLKQRVISNKDNKFEYDKEAIDNYLNELPGNKPQVDPRYIVLKQIVTGLKGAPITAARLFEMLGAETKSDKYKIGTIMRTLGYDYQRWSRNYLPAVTTAVTA